MSNFSLTKAQTNAYYEKYLTLLHDASKNGGTFKAHYEVAFYTPILFIKGETTFEATFDKILSHLENAYQKANAEKAQLGVRQSIQSLLDFHIDMVETTIEIARSGNIGSLIERITTSIRNIFKEFISNPELSDVFVITEAAEILSAYHSYFVSKKSIKNFEEKFYPQLLHVYSKVLDSNLYSSELKLISNSFIRVGKQKMLIPALQNMGLALTLQMLRQFGLSKREFGESLRILVQNMGNVSSPPTTEDLVGLIDLFQEEDLPNSQDLKGEVIKYHQSNIVPAILSKRGLATALESIQILRQVNLSRNDFGESLRILVQNLDKASPKPTAQDLTKLIELIRGEDLPNKHDLERDAIKYYQVKVIPTILHDGLDTALETLKQPILHEKDRSYALRVMISALNTQRVTEKDLKEIMKFAVEQKLLNQADVKLDLLNTYKKAFKPKNPSTFLPISISLIVALFIYIALAVQGVNITKESNDNFWSIAGKYILAITSSLLSSLYLTCGFLAVAIGLAIVVKTAISSYRERKFSQRTKGFEKELDLIAK